jgi:hypothetical protein
MDWKRWYRVTLNQERPFPIDIQLGGANFAHEIACDTAVVFVPSIPHADVSVRYS